MKNTASYDNVSVTIGSNGQIWAGGGGGDNGNSGNSGSTFHVSPIQVIMHHIIKITEIIIVQHQMPVQQQHRVDHMMWCRNCQSNKCKKSLSWWII